MNPTPTKTKRTATRAEMHALAARMRNLGPLNEHFWARLEGFTSNGPGNGKVTSREIVDLLSGYAAEYESAKGRVAA